MTTPTQTQPWMWRLVRWSWTAACLVVAGLIWLEAAPMQLERGCWRQEWPFEEGCDDLPGRFAERTTLEQRRHYLAENVGDVYELTRYALALQDDAPQAVVTLLQHLKTLNPYHHGVLWLEAETQAETQNWDAVATALVTLAERGEGRALDPLKRMMESEDARDAVLKQLTPETRWLNQLFGRTNPGLSPAAMQPFVEKGLELQILKPQTVLSIVEHLKKQGQPIDAYLLWITLKGRVNEGIYNKGFEQRVLQKGFDWAWREPGSNVLVGARVRQVPAAPREGQMLEVELTGRAGLPRVLVQQTLVLLQNEYRLSFKTASERFKTTEGLVWGLYCMGREDRWSESRAIVNTRAEWEDVEWTFKVPAECGGVVNLQLEAKASWEVKAGMTGLVHFDDFELVALTRG